MSDMAAWRAVAEAATPGPWDYWHTLESGCLEVYIPNGTTVLEFKDHMDCEECARPSAEDAAHIATFDPPTVLAILDRLEAAESKVARVEALADEWDVEFRREFPCVGPGFMDLHASELRAALEPTNG